MQIDQPPATIVVDGKEFRRPDNFQQAMTIAKARAVEDTFRSQGAPVELRQVGQYYYVYVCTCWL